MLTELMREDSSVKPIEAKLAAIDHFDERIENLGLLPDLVTEAEMFLALDERQRLHAFHRTSRTATTRCPSNSTASKLAGYTHHFCPVPI